MKRILYIEDSVTSQLIVRRILSNAYDVTIAPTPRAGNAFLHDQSFDLVISDFLFPQGDALDLVIPLRQAKTPMECPIIAISGSMDAVLMNRLLKCGVNACLSKPVKPAEFRAFVDRMIEEPFVEQYTGTISSVNCFQWYSQGQYHEYNPELKIQLSGLNRDDVSHRMQTLLHEHAIKGNQLGFASQERIRTYLVHSDSITPVDHPLPAF